MMFGWKIGVLGVFLFLHGINGGVVPVIEENLGEYFKLVKRVNDEGHPVMHIDLQNDAASALNKRSDVFKLFEKPSDEELDLFKASFDYKCGRGTPVVASLQEVFSVAKNIISNTGHYDIDGWSSPGVISLGNKPLDPKKYQEQVPIHCLGGSGKYTLVMGPKNKNQEFKYGVSFSRSLLGSMINNLIYACQYHIYGHVNQFSMAPKLERLNMVEIWSEKTDCESYVGAVCKSIDDESRAQCLSYKALFGINWTKPTSTPTTKEKPT